MKPPPSTRASGAVENRTRTPGPATPRSRRRRATTIGRRRADVGGRALEDARAPQPPAAAFEGPSPSQLTSRRRTRRVASASRGPTTTRCAPASSATTYSGSAAAIAERQAAPLADGEMDDAVMAAEHPPVDMRRYRRDSAASGRSRCDHAGCSRPDGTKQMSWLSGLSATARPRSRGQLAHLGAWAGRRAGSAGSRAARASWRTGNSSGRARGRRRGAARRPPRGHRAAT